jgi:hypothetical protein
VTALALGCAYLADLFCGDPEWFPHPVRLIGRLAASGEAFAQPGRGSVRRDLIAVAVLSPVVVALTAASTLVVMVVAGRVPPSLGFTSEVILAWTALATRSLLAEARQVLRAPAVRTTHPRVGRRPAPVVVAGAGDNGRGGLSISRQLSAAAAPGRRADLYARASALDHRCGCHRAGLPIV